MPCNAYMHKIAKKFKGVCLNTLRLHAGFQLCLPVFRGLLVVPRHRLSSYGRPAFFCGQPCDMELVTRQSERSGHQQRLLQAFTADVFICSLLVYIAHYTFLDNALYKLLTYLFCPQSPIGAALESCSQILFTPLLNF